MGESGSVENATLKIIAHVESNLWGERIPNKSKNRMSAD